MKRSRNALVLAHRYIGLSLAPLLIVISLTGSLSVYRNELDAMLNPDFFRTQTVDRHLPLSVLLERIQQQHPDQPVIALEYRPGLHETVHAYLTPGRNAAKLPEPDEIFLDPGDAHELGARFTEGCCLNRRALFPFIYRLHYSLAAGQTGLWIVGLTALVWSLDCVTGLLLTFPAIVPPWRRAFWAAWSPAWKILRPRHILRLLFDLHRACGLWLWFLLLGMAISGVALALGPQLFQPAIRSLFPMAPLSEEIALPGGPHVLTLDAAEQRALEVVHAHGWTAHPAALMLTHAPDRALFYLFSDTGELPSGFGSPLITIALDTGATTQAVFAPQGKLGDLILQGQDPFHSGRLAGSVGRALVCLSGVVTALLTVTGVLIWERKRRARRSARHKREISSPEKRVVT
ncbi:PepSY-associated TM helix domain-containing protein [Asaia astilbis]|uniref:PepSY-associated TM helix domain-containing protein n=1 Tax=Asaia astilbis TaxID=610244 RepID=UPI0005633F16|nr:PepSY-associated TM helix domain-containing protein [Asaia astilbis]